LLSLNIQAKNKEEEIGHQFIVNLERNMSILYFIKE
jgi:hypothetical protein